MEPSTIVSAVTGLIQSFSIATTTLKPPPPDFRPEPFTSYIAELGLSEEEENTIPLDIIETWQDHIFHTRNTFKTMIPEDSLAGRIIQYAKKPVRNFEEKIHKNISDFYDAQTDEVDKVALTQVWSVLKLGWKKIGDYVAHNLVEGAFLGYNDQQNFDRAMRFSFQRMMHHATRTDALRELTFHKKSLYFIRNRLPDIQRTVKTQSEKHKLWRYRWMTAEKVNILNVVLKFQFDLYSKILASLPEDSPNELKYLILSNHSKLNNILPEINASYFNQMVEIKPKSWLEQKCQDGINRLIDKLSTLDPVPVIPSRDFMEVYQDALNIMWQVYDQLLPHTQNERDFDEVLTEFVEAISADNFIYAKWISLTTITPNTEFNWLLEAADFENYKRAVDRLIHIQNQMDELITHLHNVNHNLFNAYINASISDKQISNLNYVKVNDLIYSVWDLRNKIDELRILYRMAYLKKIRTTVNECNVSYWERIKQSALNKATRKILEGEFFDRTETQQEVVAHLHRFLEQYDAKLKEIKRLTNNLSAMDINITIPKELLAPIDLGEESYPVFYNFEAYRGLFEGKTTVTNTIIRYAHYNIKRICKIMPQNEFWQAQLSEIERYIYIIQELNKISNLSTTYLQLIEGSRYNIIKKGNNPETVSSQIKKIKRNCEDICTNLPINFYKYIVSEWNRHNPVNVQRIASSICNKTYRVISEGKISDETKEFKNIYPDLVQLINAHATKLKSFVDLQDQELEAQIIGSTPVFIPIQLSSTVKSRQTRKGRRSQSLLLPGEKPNTNAM